MRLVLILELSLIKAASEVLLIGLVLSVVFLGGRNVGGAEMGVLELIITVSRLYLLDLRQLKILEL